ncbi:hypothetical protein [Breoghania sp. L-A4]|uniref:hypothetical protein n=1 Tax=Breoghania sp. L-A4 TaxID=2304600 RepID=UPI000E35E5B8|nr:hypothetical protein [Breoghania sp. L-A4]AXS39246.1 hypothetical protein D1F64_03270 [Breoghania sp. L-A4]
MSAARQFEPVLQFDLDLALRHVDEWFAATIADLFQSAFAEDPELVREERGRAGCAALLARMRLVHGAVSFGDVNTILRELGAVSIWDQVPTFDTSEPEVLALIVRMQIRFGVSIIEIFGREKPGSTVKARDALFHDLRHELQWSVGEIACWYSAHRVGPAGQTARATVRSAIERHEDERVSE